MLYDENKDLPILEAGREERYTVKEAVKLLVEEQDKIGSNTPLRVRTNLSFLVDISTLRCWRNLNPCRAATGILRICVTVRVDRSRDIPDFRILLFFQCKSSANLGLLAVEGFWLNPGTKINQPKEARTQF